MNRPTTMWWWFAVRLHRMTRPPHRAMRNVCGLFVLSCFIGAPAFAWEHWGGDRGGTRFSPLAMITPANVGNLVKAWQFRTGDLDARAPEAMARTKFQATPLFVENSVIFCSPFNEVIALDPGSGAQKWRFDPKISTAQIPANRYNCRGVAYWVDEQVAATEPEAMRFGPRLLLGGRFPDDPIVRRNAALIVEVEQSHFRRQWSDFRTAVLALLARRH